jgi:hypothetical protein
VVTRSISAERPARHGGYPLHVITNITTRLPDPIAEPVCGMYELIFHHAAAACTAGRIEEVHQGRTQAGSAHEWHTASVTIRFHRGLLLLNTTCRRVLRRDHLTASAHAAWCGPMDVRCAAVPTWRPWSPESGHESRLGAILSVTAGPEPGRRGRVRRAACPRRRKMPLVTVPLEADSTRLVRSATLMALLRTVAEHNATATESA